MTEINLTVAAPHDRENVVVEMYYEEKFVLQVGLDESGDMVVELPEKSDDWDLISRVVPFDKFIDGLQKAFQAALK